MNATLLPNYRLLVSFFVSPRFRSFLAVASICSLVLPFFTALLLLSFFENNASDPGFSSQFPSERGPFVALTSLSRFRFPSFPSLVEVAPANARLSGQTRMLSPVQRGEKWQDKGADAGDR
jgi:hypothetical protein